MDSITRNKQCIAILYEVCYMFKQSLKIAVIVKGTKKTNGPPRPILIFLSLKQEFFAAMQKENSHAAGP